ncbi:hypothetical protein R1sor_011688 [Riccia sorocarpa]|uniref:Neprosin PEP catalytic domain-containing protein n=1 Tax=Riccia sorocarpa TaxID=122646 RepID=A0ABD3I4B0_9MARC
MEHYLGTVVLFILVWSSFLQLSESAEYRFKGSKYSRIDASANRVNAAEGHQVYPDNYGDHLPHLFVYWTRDAYVSTGCYNLDTKCQPGFVNFANSGWRVGDALAPSEINGNQTELSITVFWDAGNKYWVLKVNGEHIGYWPASLFTLLNEEVATRVNFGGEITNRETDGRHTKTDMGSGEFAEAGYKKAAYIRAMQTVNLQNELVAAPLEPNNGPFSSNSSCYDAQKFSDPSSEWGTYLFYGGEGLSSSCPI